MFDCWEMFCPIFCFVGQPSLPLWALKYLKGIGRGGHLSHIFVYVYVIFVIYTQAIESDPVLLFLGYMGDA